MFSGRRLRKACAAKAPNATPVKPLSEASNNRILAINEDSGSMGLYCDTFYTTRYHRCCRQTSQPIEDDFAQNRQMAADSPVIEPAPGTPVSLGAGAWLDADARALGRNPQ